MKPKLIKWFLVVGLAPVLIVAFVAFRIASSSLSQANDHALQAVEGQVMEKLEAIRQLKESSIERYFQGIHDQIVTFSENRMVVEAMREFRTAYDDYLTEAQVTPDQIDGMRAELKTYYVDEFGKEYEAQNGKQPSIDSILDPLDDTSIALQHAYIRANKNPLGSKHELDRAPGDAKYHELHGNVHPVIRSYLDKFGYYDIFLLDPESGDIIYSVFKELDYTTSLLDGPYSRTNFAEAFRMARGMSQKDGIALLDFKQYAPSYEAPASFIASPIFDEGELIGVAIFQMPLDRISEVMSRKDGLGETGETFLVGPDKLMRSDSFYDENRSVIASFRNPGEGRVDTETAEEALKGNTGVKVATNYDGVDVVCAYAPVDIGDMRWGLLAEIHVEEANKANEVMNASAASAKTGLISFIVVMVLIAGVGIVFVAVLISNSIASPLSDTAQVLQQVAEGDFTVRMDVQSNDEIGVMAKALNTAIEKISQTMQGIAESAVALAESSSTLDHISVQMSNASSESATQAGEAVHYAEAIASHVQTVATSITQIGQSIQEISQSASQAAEVTDNGVREAAATSNVVAALGTSSEKISSVIEVIDGIAEQTNLLALNATIEAARAGQLGKGFAVVANEVKQLASGTRTATDEIGQQVNTILSDVNGTVEAIKRIADSIHSINDYQTTIAGAVEEQSVTIESIASSVNAAASESKEIFTNVQSVAQATEQTTLNAQEVRDSAAILSQMSQELQQLISQFKYSQG